MKRFPIKDAAERPGFARRKQKRVRHALRIIEALEAKGVYLAYRWGPGKTFRMVPPPGQEITPEAFSEMRKYQSQISDLLREREAIETEDRTPSLGKAVGDRRRGSLPD